LLQAQLIAQSIGQAFQVAYAEFLRANGIDDPNLLKDVDYQEVLNQQQIFGEELALFSSSDKQNEASTLHSYTSMRHASFILSSRQNAETFVCQSLSLQKIRPVFEQLTGRVW